VESLKEEIPWTTPCICHAVFVEGGLALGAATVALHGINPKAVFLVAECLLFAWWMCGIYTGLFRQELQRKYHLEVFYSHSILGVNKLEIFPVFCCFANTKMEIFGGNFLVRLPVCFRIYLALSYLE